MTSTVTVGGASETTLQVSAQGMLLECFCVSAGLNVRTRYLASPGRAIESCCLGLLGQGRDFVAPVEYWNGSVGVS